MESQPQNPEFSNNPEDFHPCQFKRKITLILSQCRSDSSPSYLLITRRNLTHYQLWSLYLEKCS